MDDLMYLGHGVSNDEGEGGGIGRHGIGELNGADSGDGNDQSTTTLKLNLLYSEYQRVSEQFSRQFEYVLRVAGIAFSAAAALLFVIVYNWEDLPGLKGEWAFWVAPLALALFYAIVIDLFYQMVVAGYYIRRLEDEIAEISGIPFFHFNNATIRGVVSFRGGHPPRLANYSLLLLFGVGIYVAAVGVSFLGLRSSDVSGWRQITYLATQILLGGTLAYSAIGLTAGLKEKFDRWITVDDRTYRQGWGSKKASPFTWSLFGYALLPRRLDFVLKMPITVGVALMTAWFMRIGLDWHMALMLLYVVICVEFLAKQATYIWNEVLDLPADRAHVYKKDRRLLARLGPAGSSLGKLLFLIRTFAALAMSVGLAHEYGLWWLPYLVGFIFVFQFVYDRWAKRGPVRRLTVASVGYAERSLAGALTIMTVAGQFDLLLLVLLSAWVVALQFSTLAHMWWAEFSHLWAENKGHIPPMDGNAETAHPGPLNHGIREAALKIWFIARGTQVELWANVVLVFLGVLLAYIYGPGDGDRPSDTRSAIGKALAGPLTAVVDWAGTVTGWIMSRREQVQEGLDRSSLQDWSWSVFALGLVVTVAVVLVRWKLRERAGVGDTPVDSKTRARNRTRSRNTLVVLVICGMIVLPVDMWLYLVAVGLALLLAVSFEWLTYDELNQLDVILNEKLNRVVPLLGSAFFSPWAVRISIAPVEPVDETSKAWCEKLRCFYIEWARSKENSLSVYDAGADGGYPYDLIIKGGEHKWKALAGEPGFHVQFSCEREPRDGQRTAIAWVNVTPISIATAATLGSGLQYPRAPAFPEVSNKPVLQVSGPVCELLADGELEPQRYVRYSMQGDNADQLKTKSVVDQPVERPVRQRTYYFRACSDDVKGGLIEIELVEPLPDDLTRSTEDALDPAIVQALEKHDWSGLCDVLECVE